MFKLYTPCTESNPKYHNTFKLQIITLYHYTACFVYSCSVSLNCYNSASSRTNVSSLAKEVLGLFRKPVFISVCVNYLLISFIRGSYSDWGHVYLVQDKGHSQLTGKLIEIICEINQKHSVNFKITRKDFLYFFFLTPIILCLNSLQNHFYGQQCVQQYV